MALANARFDSMLSNSKLESDYKCQQPVNIKCILLGDAGVGKTTLVVSYTTNDYPAQHKASALDTFCVEVCADNRPVQLQICDAGGGDEATSLRRFSYPGVHVVLLCFSVVRPQSFRSLRTQWLVELFESLSVGVQPAAEYLKSVNRDVSGGSTRSRPKGPSPAPSSNIRSRSCGSTRTTTGGGASRSTNRHENKNTLAPGPALLLVGCACDLRNDIGQLLELSKQGETPVDKRTAELFAAEIGAEAYVECSALTQKNLKTVFDLAIWCGLRIANLGGSSSRLLNGTAPTNGHASSPHSSLATGKSGSLGSGIPNAWVVNSQSDADHHQQQHPNHPRATATPADKRLLWKKLLCMT